MVSSEVVTLAADTSVEESVKSDVDGVDIVLYLDVDCIVMLTTVADSAN